MHSEKTQANIPPLKPPRAFLPLIDIAYTRVNPHNTQFRASDFSSSNINEYNINST